MLSRMWTAESEKAVTAALIDEYAAAAATAEGPEKAEMETLILVFALAQTKLALFPGPYPRPSTRLNTHLRSNPLPSPLTLIPYPHPLPSPLTLTPDPNPLSEPLTRIPYPNPSPEP